MSHALTDKQISALDALEVRLGDLETLIPLSATGGFIAIFDVASINSTLFLEIDGEAQLLKLTEQSAHTNWKSWEFEPESACFRAVKAIMDGTHGSLTFKALVGEIFEEDLAGANSEDRDESAKRILEDLTRFGFGLVDKLYEAGDRLSGWIEEFAEGFEEKLAEEGSEEEAEKEPQEPSDRADGASYEDFTSDVKVLEFLLGDGFVADSCCGNGCCEVAEEDTSEEASEPSSKPKISVQDFLNEAFKSFPQVPGVSNVSKDSRESVANLIDLLGSKRKG